MIRDQNYEGFKQVLNEFILVAYKANDNNILTGKCPICPNHQNFSLIYV